MRVDGPGISNLPFSLYVGRDILHKQKQKKTTGHNDYTQCMKAGHSFLKSSRAPRELCLPLDCQYRNQTEQENGENIQSYDYQTQITVTLTCVRKVPLILSIIFSSFLFQYFPVLHLYFKSPKIQEKVSLSFFLFSNMYVRDSFRTS